MSAAKPALPPQAATLLLPWLPRRPEKLLFTLLGLLVLASTVELGWQLSIATALERAAAAAEPDTPLGLRRALLEAAPLLQGERLSIAPAPGASYSLTYRQPLHGPLTRALWGAEIAHRALVPPPP
ncbi:hypothetical protein BKE38_10655 [Pseudoroseomonas deserti]|uniref:Uncharacterized protein n=1 Tax=Teichococcus deserti TaxID=1817963 RepID=A0A1V2H3J8_9PROT|nr:hypothetical protein [Pseudoroseomonas deserti]ONG54195.1 hypothetical protein BKE38_10655 [Pseudoroseomonas deserti]